MTRTAVYGLVNKTAPKAVYLETIDALLPALKKVTGDDVAITDILVYNPDPAEEMDDESRLWLEAELTPPLEPYDWGPEGPPEGKPFKFVEGRGWIVEGGKDG